MQIKIKITLGEKKKKVKGAAKMAKYFRSYGTNSRKYMNDLSKKTFKIQESWFGLSIKYKRSLGAKKICIYILQT